MVLVISIYSKFKTVRSVSDYVVRCNDVTTTETVHSVSYMRLFRKNGLTAFVFSKTIIITSVTINYSIPFNLCNTFVCEDCLMTIKDGR